MKLTEGGALIPHLNRGELMQQRNSCWMLQHKRSVYAPF